MPLKAPSSDLSPWDITEHLDSEEAIAAYIDAVLEEGDLALMKAAIGDLVQAHRENEAASKDSDTRYGFSCSG